MKELTRWKRPWCWERLKAGGGGDKSGWDGWMASPTPWTQIWASSGSWWWTGKPSMLQSMGSQRIRHDWAAELTDEQRENWDTVCNSTQLSWLGRDGMFCRWWAGVFCSAWYSPPRMTPVDLDHQPKPHASEISGTHDQIDAPLQENLNSSGTALICSQSHGCNGSPAFGNPSQWDRKAKDQFTLGMFKRTSNIF